MSARRYLLALAAVSALPLLSVARAQDTMPSLPPPPPSSAPPPSDAGAEPAPDAAPVATTTAPEQPPPPKDEEVGAKERFSFRGTGGFQYAQIHGIPITGARVRLGIGVQKDSSAHYGTMSILYGGTEGGLRTWDLRFGYHGDLFRWSVLRLGVSAEVGYMFVRRATIDERMWALGAGGGVFAGVDLFSFGPRDDHAVMAEARFDAHLHFGTALVWGPTISLGFRF